MLKRNLLFLAALSLSITSWTGTAKAQIPTLDNQWLTDFISQIENAKNQFDQMKAQAERMQKMAEAMCEDPVGFGKAYLESVGIPMDPNAYMPRYPQGLEQLEAELDDPEKLGQATINVLGLDDTEGSFGAPTVREISSEMRNELKKKRIETIIMAAGDAYALSLNVQQEEASIGERIEVLSEGAGDSVDARGDIGVNTGFVTEMVYKVNTLNSLLAADLKLEAALGFMDMPIR